MNSYSDQIAECSSMVLSAYMTGMGEVFAKLQATMLSINLKQVSISFDCDCKHGEDRIFIYLKPQSINAGFQIQIAEVMPKVIDVDFSEIMDHRPKGVTRESIQKLMDCLNHPMFYNPHIKIALLDYIRCHHKSGNRLIYTVRTPSGNL